MSKILVSNAFNGCTNLECMSIGDSVASIGKEAFYNVAITNLTLPSSLTSIGERPFANCAIFLSVKAKGVEHSLSHRGLCFCGRCRSEGDLFGHETNR